MFEADLQAIRRGVEAAPFSIGLTACSEDEWIETDERLEGELALKDAILADPRETAFMETPDSIAEQDEVRRRLTEFLPRRFPEIYVRSSRTMQVGAQRCVTLDGVSPLRDASRLVQEDLLLMRRERGGWTLIAGSLCFPTTWRLQDKIGLPMSEIHAPVPGFAGRMDQRIARIFDHLRDGTLVERFNLSVHGDDRLRYAISRLGPHERFPLDADVRGRAHLRVERQSLRLLPDTGAILFTVRIHLDPLTSLARRTEGPALARVLRNKIAALSPDQLSYKGLAESSDRLLQALDDVIAEVAG